jgi:hypothetical protein
VATQGQPSDSGLPWYRHFWPWFIVLLMGSAVTASIATVVIAFARRDSLVRDDWYKDGLAINRRLERDRYAEQLGIGARLELNERDGVVQVELSGQGARMEESLTLALSHATRAERDRSFELMRTSSTLFEVRAEVPGGGRWYATLEPTLLEDDGLGAARWRLTRTIWLPQAEAIPFGAAIGSKR